MPYSHMRSWLTHVSPQATVPNWKAVTLSPWPMLSPQGRGHLGAQSPKKSQTRPSPHGLSTGMFVQPVELETLLQNLQGSSGLSVPSKKKNPSIKHPSLQTPCPSHSPTVPQLVPCGEGSVTQAPFEQPATVQSSSSGQTSQEES